MRIVELRPVRDTRASFYGKAKVILQEGKKQLMSYSTIVAEIEEGKEPVVFGQYSATTTRHVKEFLYQEGWIADNLKQILKDFGADKK